MRKYKGYLIDLDGTTYFGGHRIPTAETFIKQLIEQEIPFKFVTNNATRSNEEIAQMLRQDYQLPVDPDMIYTSIQAMIDYIHHLNPKAKLYVVGEASLKRQLEEAGFQLVDDSAVDIVVQALNRQVTYADLSQATQAILNGAEFLVTNTDNLIPTSQGLQPSSGALTAFIEYATKKEPIVMGKPHAPIMEGALEQLGLAKDEVLMVGDNYNTDIQAGIQAGIDTLLVLTGVTQKEELDSLPTPATYVVEDLSHWSLT
ncbi:TIGR01457 family HAD-type hydrolase [Hutsoniella sourekii]